MKDRHWSECLTASSLRTTTTLVRARPGHYGAIGLLWALPCLLVASLLPGPEAVVLAGFGVAIALGAVAYCAGQVDVLTQQALASTGERRWIVLTDDHALGSLRSADWAAINRELFEDTRAHGMLVLEMLRTGARWSSRFAHDMAFLTALGILALILLWPEMLGVLLQTLIQEPGGSASRGLSLLAATVVISILVPWTVLQLWADRDRPTAFERLVLKRLQSRLGLEPWVRVRIVESTNAAGLQPLRLFPPR
jgi:hypothetical protein